MRGSSALLGLLRRTASQQRPCQPCRGFYGRNSGYTRFKSSGGQRSWLLSRPVLLTVGGGGVVVWLASRQEIPYTHRRHAVLISQETEKSLGIQAFEQIKASAQGKVLPPSAPASQLVRRIGTRIAKAAAEGSGSGYLEHMKGLDWEFLVIDDDQMNALAAPGGKVLVFTGLLKALRSEDQLAAVLSHEVAHVIARHTAEKVSQGGLSQLLLLGLYLATGIYIPGGFVSLVLELPNSRKMESEADEIGLSLAARACFKPGAAVSVYQILDREEARQGGAHMPAMLRTHPMSSSRIEAVTAKIPAANVLYGESGCGMQQNYLRGMFQ